MALITWTNKAKRDIEGIATYLDKRSPKYAKFVIRRLYHGVETLEKLPKIGRIVPEFKLLHIRENYRIVYLLHEDVVEILSISHARRDLSKTLLGRS